MDKSYAAPRVREYGIKDLGIFSDGSCADNIKFGLQLAYQNVFPLKAV